MTIHYCEDYTAMSKKGAELVFDEISKKPDLLFCAASGGSPAGLYQEMVSKYQQSQAFFDRLKVVKLDEWVGLPKDSSFTSEYDIQQKLLSPLEIDSARYLSFDEETRVPHYECVRIQRKLEEMGNIDLCILGIGMNGHIALNEPSSELVLDCHVAELSSSTLNSGMIKSVDVKLKYGMTMGIGNILKSRKVILFISGSGKKQALEKLLKREITTQLPASMLWLHANVDLIIDNSIHDRD